MLAIDDHYKSSYIILFFSSLLLLNLSIMSTLWRKAYKAILEELSGDKNFVENYLGFDLIKSPIYYLIEKAKVYVKNKKSSYPELCRRIKILNFFEVTSTIQMCVLPFIIFYFESYQTRGEKPPQIRPS